MHSLSQCVNLLKKKKTEIVESQIDVDDNVMFFREENEAIEYIESLIEFGLKANCIPVICAYNLMFDLQTLIYNLNCY